MTTGVQVFSIPLRTRFRGLTEREGLLLEGPAGWGEFSPFLEYDAAVSDLEKALTEGRGKLDASTIAIVEHNLQTIEQAIQQARQTVRTSTEPIPASRLNSELKWLIETRPAARVDYIEFCDPDTLQPIVKVQRGAHIALAVFVGKTRLIDHGKV